MLGPGDPMRLCCFCLWLSGCYRLDCDTVDPPDPLTQCFDAQSASEATCSSDPAACVRVHCVGGDPTSIVCPDWPDDGDYLMTVDELGRIAAECATSHMAECENEDGDTDNVWVYKCGQEECL
jgi:hypothetical protein